MEQLKTIKIDDVEYVRKKDVVDRYAEENGRQFAIVRSYGAGVFAGWLDREDDTPAGKEVILDGCIRLHRWTGCSLSQVANDGVSGTGENRFSMQTNQHRVMNVIEIIPCTKRARMAILEVKTWKL